MHTEKPRSPLDRAAMRICRLANPSIPSVKIERHWDLTLTPMARSIYRTTALEVFGELAPEGVAPREDGAEVTP